MPVFEVTAPNGKTYEITAPDGASHDEVLAYAQAHHINRTLDDYKAMSAPVPVDPTEGMSEGAKGLAGIGMGMSRIGRGIGQAVGAVSQQEIDQRHAEEAPLANDTSGKIGNFVGTVAALAPAAFIPGANTVAGAAAIGAGTSALTTEGGIKERAGAALGGAVGGAAGVAAGRALSYGAGLSGVRAAARGIDNNVTNQSARDAIEAGYRIPVSDMAQSGPGRFAGRMAESVGGKAATAQTALRTNQQVTNRLVRQDLGLGGAGQIGRQDLDRAMRPHLAVYAEAERVSPDAAFAVRQWRNANDQARRYTREFNTNYTVAAEDAAIAARQEANQWLQVVEQEAGTPGLAQRLANARVQLARIGTVEDAINEGTGNVSATHLAKALDRGVPLQGGTRRAAEFGRAFADYAKPPKGMPGVSKLDAWTAGAGLAGAPITGGASLGVAALPVVSYATRNALLSRPIQRLAAPAIRPGAARMATANALLNRDAQALEGVAGNALSRRPVSRPAS